MGSTCTAGGAGVSRWTVTWPLAAGQSINHVWNGTLVGNGSPATVSNVEWNGTLGPNASTQFGFVANGSPSTPTLTCR